VIDAELDGAMVLNKEKREQVNEIDYNWIQGRVSAGY
jgi:hypothetical protein